MKALPARSLPGCRAVRGFSLIELMVGVTIALIVTLVIFNVLVASETRKRSTTLVNDINQSGAYSAYVLDRAIRSAGSGFANQRLTLLRRAEFESCALNITRGGNVIAPRATDYPAPFNVAALRRPVLAPVIIDPGADSDILTVMSGSQGRAEVGNPVIGTSPSGVAVDNTFSFSRNDLVLFGRNANEGECFVSQVAGATGTVTFTPQVPPTIDAPNENLPLAGTYVSAVSSGTLALSDLALSLGNPTTNRPQFKMYGVDAGTQTLRALDIFSFDYADLDSPLRSEPVADGVIEMRAIYGVDTVTETPVPLPNQINEWVLPVGDWAPAALRDGSAVASDRLRRIVAVRLALVLRTALEERDAVPASNSFTIFSDVPAASMTVPSPSVVLPGNPANFRYRVIETTIPLRNNLQ